MQMRGAQGLAESDGGVCHRPEPASVHGDVKGEEAGGERNGGFGHGRAGGDQCQAQQLEPILENVLQLCVRLAVIVVCDRQAHQPRRSQVCQGHLHMHFPTILSTCPGTILTISQTLEDSI